MKKVLLVTALFGAAFTLSSCLQTSNSTHNWGDKDAQACHDKCRGMGQHMAVTPSVNAKRCICTNDSTSTR